ncbi:hypothetical protein CHUAL_004589 [Chamberlinius hualienensis]
MENENSFSLPNQAETTIIDDTHTDLSVIDFEDRLFVVVSQYEKVGSLVSSTSNGMTGPVERSPTYTTKVLFGKDELELHAFALHLSQKLQSNKPVLFSLSFKKWPSVQGGKVIVEKLLQMLSQMK